MGYLVIHTGVGDRELDGIFYKGSQVDLRLLLDMILPAYQLVNGQLRQQHFKPPTGDKIFDMADVVWSDGVTQKGHSHDGVDSAIIQPETVRNYSVAGPRRSYNDYGVVRGPRTTHTSLARAYCHYMAHGKAQGAISESSGTRLSYLIEPPIDFTEWLFSATSDKYLVRPHLHVTWEHPKDTIGYFNVCSPSTQIIAPTFPATDNDVPYTRGTYFEVQLETGGEQLPASMERGSTCHWILSAIAEPKV